MRSAVSIVIPVYNTEKYLRMAVDSVIAQTLQDIEIILVDDGSSDKSGMIADEYARKDNRVRVIHQNNCGAGLARNTGIMAANGEYVGFVDSDDWVDAEMFQSLYIAAKSHDSDIAMCGCKRESDRGTIETVLLPIATGTYEKDEIKQLVLIPMIAPSLVHDNWKSIINSIWKNIYRRDMLLRNNIKFKCQRLIYAEDLMFNLEAFRCVNILSVVNKPLYHYYRENSCSLTKIYQPNFNNMILTLNNSVENFISSCDLKLNYKELMKIRMIISIEMMIANVFRPGNSSSFLGKVKQIKDILDIPKIHEVLRSLNLKDLPLKKRINGLCYRHRLSFLICLHYEYSIRY